MTDPHISQQFPALRAAAEITDLGVSWKFIRFSNSSFFVTCSVLSTHWIVSLQKRQHIQRFNLRFSSWISFRQTCGCGLICVKRIATSQFQQLFLEPWKLPTGRPVLQKSEVGASHATFAKAFELVHCSAVTTRLADFQKCWKPHHKWFDLSVVVCSCECRSHWLVHIGWVSRSRNIRSSKTTSTLGLLREPWHYEANIKPAHHHNSRIPFALRVYPPVQHAPNRPRLKTLSFAATSSPALFETQVGKWFVWRCSALEGTFLTFTLYLIVLLRSTHTRRVMRGVMRKMKNFPFVTSAAALACCVWAHSLFRNTGSCRRNVMPQALCVNEG